MNWECEILNQTGTQVRVTVRNVGFADVYDFGLSLWDLDGIAQQIAGEAL